MSVGGDRTASSVDGAGKIGDHSVNIRSAQSRQAILDAAHHLFVAHGYSATSVQDIVERAGTSVGLPYYHFGSKKQIFVALWQDYQDAQEARTKDAVTNAKRAGKAQSEQLLAGVRAYLEGAWECRDMLPLVMSRDTPPGFDTLTQEANKRWEKQNISILSGRDRGRVRIAVVAITGVVASVCSELARGRSNADARTITENTLVLLDGLLGRLD